MWVLLRYNFTELCARVLWRSCCVMRCWMTVHHRSLWKRYVIADCYRLTGNVFLNVNALMDHFTSTVVCRKEVPISPGETKHIICQSSTIGGILRIYASSKRPVYLSLCEVQVFGSYGKVVRYYILKSMSVSLVTYFPTQIDSLIGLIIIQYYWPASRVLV